MSKPLHTTGKWEVAKSGTSVNAGQYVKIRQERGAPDAELRANARLIAAGPTMLETLLEVKDAIDPDENPPLYEGVIYAISLTREGK